MTKSARTLIGGILLAGAGALFPACSSAPIPLTYSQVDLQQICERQGGWWRPDALMGGYCEYQAPEPH